MCIRDSHLTHDISFDVDKNIQNKVNRFQHICGTINRTLKNKTRRETKLKFYKTMAGPMLVNGSESVSYTHLDVYKRQVKM